MQTSTLPDTPKTQLRPEWLTGPYRPPTITYLGSLRELTLGGTTGPNDGVGGGGGIGSV